MKKIFTLLSIFAISFALFAGDFFLLKDKRTLDTPDTKANFFKEGVKITDYNEKSIITFFEGFESGAIPAGWTVVNGNADGYQFSVVDYATGAYEPISDDGGTYYAEYNDDAAGSSNPATIEELISPSIAIDPAILGMVLMYDFNMQDCSGYGYFESQVRVFGSGSWGPWGQMAFHTVDEISSDTLSLNAAMGYDSLQLKFLFNDENYFGWGMGIDNIEIAFTMPDTNDLSPIQCLTPQIFVSPVIIFNPEIEVRNYGLNDQNDGFMLTVDIYDINNTLLYADTVISSDTIFSNTSKTYVMSKNFKPEYLKEYTLIAITHLASDDNNANDTLTFDFRTHDLEVALNNFVYPAVTMDYLTDYLITVDVVNNGSQTADFDVRLIIANSSGEMYNSSVEVNSLGGGGWTTVNFPQFSYPHDLGGYTFTVFSEMTADYDRSNDTLTGESYCTAFWELDPVTISARYASGSCVYDDGFFVIGGRLTGAGTLTSEVQFFSPDSGWSILTNLPTPSGFHLCALIDNKIYVIGGYTGSVISTVNIYDIAGNSWTTGTPMPVGLAGASGGWSNGKIYIVGGSIDGNMPTYTYSYVYTPSADTIGGTPWDTLASCPSGSNGFFLGAMPIGNELDSLLFVGGNYSGSTADYYMYNINQNTWTTTAHPGLETGGQCPAVIYDKSRFFLVSGATAGGWSAGSQRTYSYDFASDLWTNHGILLNYNAISSASALLPDGMMHISGGHVNSLIHEKTHAGLNQIDTKAPFILSTNPAHKAVSVPFDKAIIVEFSEKIDTSMGYSFDVNPNPGLILGVWSSSQESLYIFHEDLSVNTTYYITIASAFDTIGYPLKTASVPNPFGFSTGVTGVNGQTKSNLKTKLDMPNTNVTNSFVRFDYSSAGEGNIQMDVFSMNGSLIKNLVNGKISSGTHKVIWDLKDNSGKVVPSGTYIYKFTSGKYSASGKLTIIK